MSEMPHGSVSGVLEIMQKGGGFLRDPGRSFAPDSTDVFVPRQMIQKLKLSNGAMVVGGTAKGRQGTVLARHQHLRGGSRPNSPPARP